MKTPLRPVSVIVLSMLAVTLVANLAACGTIIYPDRNGQKAGQIDPLVAVLDGFGLLFFLVPGVIAFAVDFNNHSIYLPRGHKSRLGAALDPPQAPVTGKLDRAAIENWVQAASGTAIDLGRKDIRVIRVGSPADLDAAFARWSHSPP